MSSDVPQHSALEMSSVREHMMYADDTPRTLRGHRE